MWSILALGAAERLIHHVIDLDAISRIQLNKLQGKMLRVVMDSPQLSVDVFFDENKVRLEPTVTGQSGHNSIFEQRPFDKNEQVFEATATLHVKNVVALLKLFLADDVGNIPLQGDYHLLQDIQRILQQAEPVSTSTFKTRFGKLCFLCGRCFKRRQWFICFALANGRFKSRHTHL